VTKKVVGVFVRFRAPLHAGNSLGIIFVVAVDFLIDLMKFWKITKILLI
jgi:hypothetical protein